MADTKTNYLAKLLTLLVRRDGGTLRIPIQDLMIDDIGQGISVHFDQDKKELVISYVPAGTTIYKIEGATSWLATTLPQVKNTPAPLSQDQLVERIWTESAATPTNQESQHPKNKVVVLTSESMAEAESDRRKQKALREIENYQSPQPSISRQMTRSSAATMFSKP